MPDTSVVTPPAESALEVTVSPRKMPRRARNALLLGLGGALAVSIAVFAWLIPPRGLLFVLISVPLAVMVVAVIGLYIAGIVVETTLRIDQVGIHARQWRFAKELPFARIKRIYLFRDGRQDKLAVVPLKDSAWFIGLGLSEEELDAVCSRLDAVARTRGIEFLRNLTFAEILEHENEQT